MKNYIRRDLIDKRMLSEDKQKSILFSHSDYVVGELAKIIADSRAFSINRKSSLEDKIAKSLDCRRDNILLSSDFCSLVEGVFKIFLNPLDKVLIQVPSMSDYKNRAEFFHAKVIDYELARDFTTDYKSLKEYAGVYSPKLLIIDDFDIKKGIKRLDKFLSKVDFPLVLDDRHGEFFDSKYKELINKYDNLILLKSFYYANTYVSYVVSSKEVIKSLKEMGNCSMLSDYDRALCDLIFDDLDYYKEKAQNLEKSRDVLRERLDNNTEITEINSLYKNYLLFKCSEKEILSDLEEEGLRLKNLGNNKRFKKYYILEVHNADFI